jgi:peptide/nickel transport system substrate-binding protein
MPIPPRLTALAAGIVVAAVGLTACSTNAVSPPTAGSISTTILTPKGNGQVDKITWNVFEGEPQTIDPYHSADYTPNMINSNMCETLLAQTPDFQIKPNLATSFANPDPLTWVYELRDDVTFWDGTPMTADDVAYSLNVNHTDKTTSYNYVFSNVASVTKTGAHEVTIKLSKPDYLLNEELASFAGVVVEQKFHQQAGTKFGTPTTGVMCTGPYKFVKWTQGQSMSATRYDGYWNKNLPLKVKNIDFTFLTDDNAITSGLLAGQIDGAYNVPISGHAQLKASSAGKYYAGPGPLVSTLILANPQGALANLNVRRALQMAIDRKGIGTQTFGGLGTPGKLQTPVSAYGFARDQLTALAAQVNSDGTPQIDEAKKLLADVPADVKAKQISFVVPSRAVTQQVGVAVKAAADQIGLNFKLTVVPETGYSNYLYDPATRGATDLLYTQFWPNIPNPLDWLSGTAVSGASFNMSGYSGIDQLFDQARSTADTTARAELVTQMEKKLYDEMTPMFPGVELLNDVWMNNRITGAPASFAYVYYPWAAYLGGTT